ncbi:hypothetical protein H8D36_00365 [archaeon]|nr:hypothetical protein [archaeon]MBL7057447.1 hypothetical protein [Candidatus Woesearchaeota archaeon]
MALTNFKGTVVKKEYLAPDVIILSFKLDADISFQTGQYVMMKIHKGDSFKNRAYSILNPPSQKETMDFCIKIVEDGFASEVFAEMEVGFEVEMKGPLGTFVFEDKNDIQFMIAVGTGLAPMYSILKEHLEAYPDKKFKLLFGARTRKDLVFHEEFLEIEKTHDNFEYIPTITREEWDGRQGRVHQHLGTEFENTTFYLCGLKEMVTQTKDELLKNGVLPENIKAERYS